MIQWNKMRLITAMVLLLVVLTGCTTITNEKTDTAKNSQTDAAVDHLFTEWIPESIPKQLAQQDKNADLEQAIIEYYQIPEEAWADTKYYYEYVDLNSDGTNEILAVVIGSYTSGSGGDSMLWLIPDADMAVNQAFSLIRMPIIVTDETVNGQTYGAKGLIVQRSGGGAETETVLLTCQDGIYKTVNEGTRLDAEALENVSGTAIFCNDILQDMQDGNYLTLAPEQA